MPRTRSLAWSQLKIGIVAVVAVALAAFLVMSVGGQGFFWQLYRVRTRFPDVLGLKTGAVVRVAGVEVGSVDAMRFDGAEIEVTLKLQRSMQPLVTEQSVASIGRSGCSGRPSSTSRPRPAARPCPTGAPRVAPGTGAVQRRGRGRQRVAARTDRTGPRPACRQR